MTALPRASIARIAAGLAVAVLAGCSVVAPRPSTAPPAPAAEQQPAEVLAAPSGRLKPMPLRTFTVATDCRFRDETGSSGKATVDVSESKVRALNVELTMPKHGICRYELASFHQTQALPSVELEGPRDCRVRMWEQGEQITVAFAGCYSMCSPSSAHDYVWPLLIDKNTGKCD
ncbi:MAG: hypothetical protein JSS57_09390 [Proteobacteria bacterium]|nr:hypothetical protein [Pseudomonadota bacterium]RTL37067.1 MAG: hypothetical protein EKK49_05925 [Rhodocyclaceae bacterium]